MNPTKIVAATVVIACGSTASLGQDSVSLTPGGNDALSAFDAAGQRVRYVVDGAPAVTSWGNPIIVAPIMKASRDIDPMFRTQILGSVAISPDVRGSVGFPAVDYSRWTSAGAGVNAGANSAGTPVGISGFDSQFGIAISDFSLAPSSVVTATVGRLSSDLSRFYVERTVAASSRASAAGPDTSTLSLGGVDASGNVALRADAFTALAGTATRLLGDNVVRVSPSLRGAGVNVLTGSGSSNAAADAAATSFVISNEATPTNTPAILNQAGVGPFAVAFDFAGRLRTGSTTGNLATTTTHLPSGIIGHRGNPSYVPLTALGGIGTVAALGVAAGEAQPRRVVVFGVSGGTGGAAPGVVAGSPRSFELASPLLGPDGFNVNPSAAARFLQYGSQLPFRGGNGPVAIGAGGGVPVLLAATATEPTLGEFIPVLRFTPGSGFGWEVAARAGQSVLSSVSGQSVGTIPAAARFSSPGLDVAGNVFFVADYQPLAGPATTGLFRAARTSAGYRLELLLAAGQTITGVNSQTPYTIASLTLGDSESAASGTMFSSSVLQPRDPGASSTIAWSVRRFGGVVVSAVLNYSNSGVGETYDALLLVAPAPGIECDSDFDRSGTRDVSDIFAFLSAWFAGDLRADFDGDGGRSVTDIFAFLSSWFQGC